VKNFVILLFCYYSEDDLNKKDEVDQIYKTNVKIRNAYKILVEKLYGRDHLGNLGIDGRILLKGTFKK
jgi:hypothetical protein